MSSTRNPYPSPLKALSRDEAVRIYGSSVTAALAEADLLEPLTVCEAQHLLARRSIYAVPAAQELVLGHRPETTEVIRSFPRGTAVQEVAQLIYESVRERGLLIVGLVPSKGLFTRKLHIHLELVSKREARLSGDYLLLDGGYRVEDDRNA